MQFDHFLEKRGFRAHHVFDALAGDRVGKKAHEIARMSRSQRRADFAVALEAADSGAMPGARIDHHKWPQTPRIMIFERIVIGPQIGGRDDTHESVVDRPRQRAPVHDQLGAEIEHVGRAFVQMLVVLIAALAHHVGEQHRALPRVDRVVGGRVRERRDGRKCVRRSGGGIVGCSDWLIELMHAALTSSKSRHC